MSPTEANRRRMNVPRNTFGRDDRLRHQIEFDRVFREGVYVVDACLVLHARANACGRCRLGLSISKKVGNAVLRNRWKRLIREAFRCSRRQLPEHLDLVVRPRRGARPDAEQIRQSLTRLAARAAQRCPPNPNP